MRHYRYILILFVNGGMRARALQRPDTVPIAAHEVIQPVHSIHYIHHITLSCSQRLPKTTHDVLQFNHRFYFGVDLARVSPHRFSGLIGSPDFLVDLRQDGAPQLFELPLEDVVFGGVPPFSVAGVGGKGPVLVSSASGCVTAFVEEIRHSGCFSKKIKTDQHKCRYIIIKNT